MHTFYFHTLTHTRGTLEFFNTFVVAAAALRAHCALAATTTAAAAAAAGSRILQIVAAAFGHFKSENVLLAENDREREDAKPLGIVVQIGLRARPQRKQRFQWVPRQSRAEQQQSEC